MLAHFTSFSESNLAPGPGGRALSGGLNAENGPRYIDSITAKTLRLLGTGRRPDAGSSEEFQVVQQGKPHAPSVGPQEDWATPACSQHGPGQAPGRG